MSSDKRIIQEIKGGNDQLVSSVARDYFPGARKFLRMNRVHDTLTPITFSSAFVKILTEIRRGKISELSDFNSLLNNALIRESAERKNADSEQPASVNDMQADVASQCVTVLDEQSRQLLFLRYAERKTYEEIAAAFNYSNPVIAQFETEKAYRQLEGIIKVRLNLTQN